MKQPATKMLHIMCKLPPCALQLRPISIRTYSLLFETIGLQLDCNYKHIGLDVPLQGMRLGVGINIMAVAEKHKSCLALQLFHSAAQPLKGSQHISWARHISIIIENIYIQPFNKSSQSSLQSKIHMHLFLPGYKKLLLWLACTQQNIPIKTSFAGLFLPIAYF